MITAVINRYSRRAAPIALAGFVLLAAASAVAKPAAGAEGPEMIREVLNGSWSMACFKALGKGDRREERCSVSQVVMEGKASLSRVVLGITVDAVDDPRVPTMQIRTRPNAQQGKDLGILIDNSAELRLKVDRCFISHCQATGRLTPAVLQAWSSGRVAQVAYLDVKGEQQTAVVNLKGFRESMYVLPGGRSLR